MWHLIPSIHSLKAFDAVARHQSMTRAAAEANVTQSAISQSISQLEDFIQARLIDRASRPIVLTEEGERFHRLMGETYARVAQHVEDLRARRLGDSQSVTLACNLGIATYWLMPRLNEFNQMFPDATLNVMTAYQGNATLQGGIDVAIRFGKGQGVNGGEHLLFEEQAIPVCAPSYLDKRGPVEDPAALLGHRLIHVVAANPSWMGWAQYLERVGAGRSASPAGMRFSNYVQAVQSCLAGDGIMLGWRSTACDLLAANQLIIAVDLPLSIGDGYYCQVAPEPRNRKIVRALVEWLTESARQTPEFIAT